MLGRSSKKNDKPCGERNYRVQLYSRRALLVREFCLDAQEHDLPDMEAAEQYLQQTLAPCDFASTATLISDDGQNDETISQFELKRPWP
jgi:hypothetical protein